MLRPVCGRGCAQPTSLNDVVNAREIEATGILDDPQVQEVLLPLMPDGQQTEHELRETVSQPIHSSRDDIYLDT